MRSTHSRSRRFFKWAGLFSCVLLVALWFHSIRTWVCLDAGGFSICSVDGALGLLHSSASSPAEVNSGVSVGPITWTPRLLQYFTGNRSVEWRGVGIPFWIPLLAIATPTAILWRHRLRDKVGLRPIVMLVVAVCTGCLAGWFAAIACIMFFTNSSIGARPLDVYVGVRCALSLGLAASCIFAIRQLMLHRRRFTKWVGTAVWLAGLALWCLTLTMDYSLSHLDSDTELHVGGGSVGAYVSPPADLFLGRAMWTPKTIKRPVLWLPASRPTGGGGNTTGIEIPLWIPLLGGLFALRLLWRRDNCHPAGHCQNCGYDLTGNVTGVCSECGKDT